MSRWPKIESDVFPSILSMTTHVPIFNHLTELNLIGLNLHDQIELVLKSAFVKISTCNMLNIYNQKSCCVGGTPRTNTHLICRLSRETSELTEDGSITNAVMAQHKRIWTLSLREEIFFFYFFIKLNVL